MTWYRDQDITNIRKAVAEVGDRGEIARKLRTGQVTLINAVACKRFELGCIPPPDSYIATAARKLQGQRRSPGSGADDGNRM